MQTIYVHGGMAAEVLPVSEVPLADRYAADFLADCVQGGDEVAPGWVWNGTTFAAPPPVAASVPRQVTMVQAVLALHAAHGSAAGKTLLDDVEAAVAAASDPRIALAWKRASVLDRDGVFLAGLAPSLGLDAAKLDALFVAAAGIVV